MAEILLENFDGQAEIAAEIVKLPLALRKLFDNLLTSGALHLFRSTVLGVLDQPLMNRHIVDIELLDHTDTVAHPHTD